MKTQLTRVYPEVSVALINGVNQESVNAKELYNFLKDNGNHPQKWLDSAIKNYGFERGIDFEVSHPDAGASILPSSILVRNVQVSMVMAKELALLSRSQYGRAYRRHLIQLEENVARLHKAYLAEMEQRVSKLENKQVNEYFSAREFFESKGVFGISKDAMKINGSVIKAFCVGLGVPVHAIYNRGGQRVVNVYPLGALNAWWKSVNK